MAKRGQKATKADELDEHDRQNLRTLLRKAGGNLETLVSWAKEELRPILIELRDEEILPHLMFMEESTWKYTRLPKVKRINQQRDREMGVKTRLFTREEAIRMEVNTHYPELHLHEKKAAVRRLTQKLRLRLRMSRGPR
jgi:hypothetical protein